MPDTATPATPTTRATIWVAGAVPPLRQLGKLTMDAQGRCDVLVSYDNVLGRPSHAQLLPVALNEVEIVQYRRPQDGQLIDVPQDQDIEDASIVVGPASPDDRPNEVLLTGLPWPGGADFAVLLLFTPLSKSVGGAELAVAISMAKMLKALQPEGEIHPTQVRQTLQECIREFFVALRDNRASVNEAWFAKPQGVLP